MDGLSIRSDDLTKIQETSFHGLPGFERTRPAFPAKFLCQFWSCYPTKFAKLYPYRIKCTYVLAVVYACQAGRRDPILIMPGWCVNPNLGMGWWPKNEFTILNPGLVLACCQSTDRSEFAEEERMVGVGARSLHASLSGCVPITDVSLLINVSHPIVFGGR